MLTSTAPEKHISGAVFRVAFVDKLTLVRRIARRHAPPFSLRENPQYYLPHFSAFGTFSCGKAAFCRRRHQKKQPAKAGCFFGAGGGGLNLDKLTLVRRIARRHAPPFSLRENPQYYLPHFSAFGTFSCGKAAFCRRRHQKNNPQKRVAFFGAGGGGRTRTVSLPLDFESSTSANSITPAYNGDSITHIGEKIKGFGGIFCRLFFIG